MLRLGTGWGYFRFRSQRFPALLLRLGTDMGFFRFRSQRFPALLMRLGTEAFLSEKSSTFLISFCRLFLEISCVYPISLLCLQIYGEQFVKILLPYPNDLKSCGSIFEKNSFCTQPPLYVVPISRNTASVPKPDSFHELAGRPCELHPCELHSYALHPSELPL